MSISLAPQQEWFIIKSRVGEVMQQIGIIGIGDIILPSLKLDRFCNKWVR